MALFFSYPDLLMTGGEGLERARTPIPIDVMKRILVCIDGSDYTESCCQHASWIAARAEAVLEVVYVTDLRQFEVPFIADLGGSLGLQPYQAVMGELQALEAKKSKLILQHAERVIRDTGFEGEIIQTHRTGFLLDCLSELEEHVDLVLLGKRGENANFYTEHLGATMERVLRAATKPCFVASRKFERVEKVLLAYVDSPCCRKALEFLKGSCLFKGVEIHLVSVASGANEADTLEALRSAESELEACGLEPNTQMLHGSTASAIARYAEESGVDLLLMGAHSHSKLRRLFLGSTTTEVLRGCRLPAFLFK